METKNPPIQSLFPPQSMFGYTYHALMIPPIPPRSILILGYGGGTVARLIKNIWPFECRIEGVDIDPHAGKYSQVSDSERAQVWCMDADMFVKSCTKSYDYVIVDLFIQDRIPMFVFTQKFVSKLRAITEQILAINCTFYKWDDFNIYDKYFTMDCVKQVNSDKVLFFNTVIKN